MSTHYEIGCPCDSDSNWHSHSHNHVARPVSGLTELRAEVTL